MNPVGFLILLVVLAVVLFAPRRGALLGVAAGGLFLTYGISVDIIGINFFAFRFVGMAAFLRVMVRGEFAFRNMVQIDRIFLTLCVFTAVVFVLRSTVDHAYHVGRSVDAWLCYFAFRGLITSIDDLRLFLRSFAILLIPYVALIFVESLTNKNPFTLIGGTDSSNWQRDGRLRCMGSFRHPSLLGGFGAYFLPLYLGLGLIKSTRRFAAIGTFACLAIIWGSNSGGPASGAAVAIVGWSLWILRSHLRAVRYALLAAFVAAAVLMNAPVWYLPTRASGLLGGSGWHRSYLIDQAINDFDRWWLAGMPIRDTAHWFPYVIKATGGADITNQFLVFGLTAGIGALILFTIVVVKAFQLNGQSLAASRLTSTDYQAVTDPLLWGLGVAVVVHLSSWFGISYFDQSYAFWLFHLAAIVGISETIRRQSAARLDELSPYYGYTYSDEPVHEHPGLTEPPDTPVETGRGPDQTPSP